MTEERARQAELYLVGMVCYYGKHYSTFFFQTKIRKWMYFDDAHVKEVRCASRGRRAATRGEEEEGSMCSICCTFRSELQRW